MDDVIIPFKPMTDEDDRRELYYSFPQVLLLSPRYKLSHSAIVLYAILRNRRNMSRSNIDKYRDSDGIFIIFPRKDLALLMGVDVSSMGKYFKELTQYGLVNEVRRGLGKPNKIYFGGVDASEWSNELEKHNFDQAETAEDDGKKQSTDIGNLNVSECESQDQQGKDAQTLKVSSTESEIVNARHRKSQCLEVEKADSSNTNTNKQDKTNKNFANAKLVQAHPLQSDNKSQTTLFSMPTRPIEKAKPNTVKRALQDISEAREGLLSWEKISPRDFTYYFITKHNELLPEKIVVEIKSSQVPNMKAFITNYNIPNEEVCNYIDELLKSFSDGARGNQLSLRMLGHNYKVVSEMMRHARVKFDYAKESEQPASNSEKRQELTSEVF